MEFTCRLCLHKIDSSNEGTVQLIYDGTSVSDSASEEVICLKLNQLIGFEIKLKKIWPSRICQSCLKSLNAAHDFRMMCIKNQEKLETIELEKIETEDLNCNLRHNVEKERGQSACIISECSGVKPMDFVENETESAILTKNEARKRITRDVQTKMQKQNSQENQKSLQKSKNRLRERKKRDLIVIAQISSKVKNIQNSTTKTGSSAKSLELKVICEICGMKYRSESVLTLHMRRHMQIKPFECEICHKSFVTKPQLERHMRVHTGDRPFTCKFCDRKFSDVSTIKRHERIHTKERPYVCKCCSKSFAYLTCLKDHMVTHTGEKPFRCDPCNKIFARKKLLKQHIGTLIHQQVANDCKTEKQSKISQQTLNFDIDLLTT